MLADDLPWPELGNVSRGATRGNQGQKGALSAPDAEGRALLQLRVQPGVLAVRLNRTATEWYRLLDDDVNRALKQTKTYWRKARRRQDYDQQADQDHMELHEWLQQLKDKVMSHLEFLMQKGDIQGPPYIMQDHLELTFLRKYIERRAQGIPHNPRLRNMSQEERAQLHTIPPDDDQDSNSSANQGPGDTHMINWDVAEHTHSHHPHHRSPTTFAAPQTIMSSLPSTSSNWPASQQHPSFLPPSTPSVPGPSPGPGPGTSSWNIYSDYPGFMRKAESSKTNLRMAHDQLRERRANTQGALKQYLNCVDAENVAYMEVLKAEKARDELMEQVMRQSVDSMGSRISSPTPDQTQTPLLDSLPHSGHGHLQQTPSVFALPPPPTPHSPWSAHTHGPPQHTHQFSSVSPRPESGGAGGVGSGHGGVGVGVNVGVGVGHNIGVSLGTSMGGIESGGLGTGLGGGPTTGINGVGMGTMTRNTPAGAGEDFEMRSRAASVALSISAAREWDDAARTRERHHLQGRPTPLLISPHPHTHSHGQSPMHLPPPHALTTRNSFGSIGTPPGPPSAGAGSVGGIGGSGGGDDEPMQGGFPFGFRNGTTLVAHSV